MTSGHWRSNWPFYWRARWRARAWRVTAPYPAAPVAGPGGARPRRRAPTGEGVPPPRWAVGGAGRGAGGPPRPGGAQGPGGGAGGNQPEEPPPDLHSPV